MEGKLMPGWLMVLVMLFSGCSQPTREPSSNVTPTPRKSAATPAPLKVYDVRNQDLTQVSGLTSLNIAVEGVQLGTPTRDVDRLLGKPLKTVKTPQAYRCAYREHGLYLDVDKYAGKVSRIYLNTLYSRQLRGGFADLLTKGDLRQLKKTFGENPEQSAPDPQTIKWNYPRKGIAFLEMKQEEETTYTLELSEPKR